MRRNEYILIRKKDIEKKTRTNTFSSSCIVCKLTLVQVGWDAGSVHRVLYQLVWLWLPPQSAARLSYQLFPTKRAREKKTKTN